MTSIPLLSLIIFVPLIGALMVLVTNNDKQAKVVALTASGISFLLSLVLYAQFDVSSNVFQFVEHFSWVKFVGISYKLGVDGINLPFIMLTTFLTMLTVIYSWDIVHRYKEYFFFLLLAGVGVLGVFSALDMILFFIFWEVVLIPMYFLIGIWGGDNCRYAAIKFFIYTHLGSVLMLIVMVVMSFSAAQLLGEYTFDMEKLTGVSYLHTFQIITFAVLFFAFCIKMSLVPVHTWLPDAHVQAPTAGSVLLAGVLLKMGGYGLIRIAMMMLPQGMTALIPVMYLVAIISILYAAFVALAQDDLKRMIAYSSISHMGFVLLGLATLNQQGINGAIFQMVGHGLIAAILFMICGAIQHGTKTRNISQLGGLAYKTPIAMSILALGSFASFGLPGFVGFVGEFTILVGVWQTLKTLAVLALLGMVITVGYYIWAFQRIAFGDFNNNLDKVQEVKWYELLPMTGLLIFIIFFGLYPNPLFAIIESGVANILKVFS